MVLYKSILINYKKYFFLILFFFTFAIIFLPKLTYAADCSDVNGTTVTISSDCTGRLNVSGDSSNITINSGVTVSGQTSNDRFAIDTTDGTNITITNNGNIGPTALERYGIYHNTGSGTITAINNNGTIEVNETGSGGVGTAIFNKSTIENINNTGTIKSNTRNAIANGSGGVINKIDNTGTIWSVQRWAIKNITGTISTIANSGTIKTNDEAAIRNYGGTISTINNSGTISGKDNTIQNLEDSTITEIINSSTITSSGTKKKTIRNEGTITSLNNSGTISATHNSNNYGTIHNFSTGTITTVTNSGTISSTASYGIENLGTITTITNKGTIQSGTGSGDVDIKNTSGTIGTLSNDQGGNDALTYDVVLPTNYNVIVNSTSDYGKIVFSNKSGTTTFGVDSTSTLTGSSVNTTYSDVISGLTESDLESCTSDTDCITGNKFEGTNKYNWKLDDTNGDDDWDLIITSIASSIPTAPELPRTPTLESMNSLKSVTDANFAHMNTYDCDFFGNNNDSCLSLGARRSEVTSPSSTTDGIVLVAGKKYSDYLRFGGFYHTNTNHKTSKNLKLSDKTPLLGSLIVWNQSKFGLGFQVKYANAYQEKNATITREAGENSETGTGTTTTSAISNTIESRYIFSKKHKINYIPYFAARHAIKTQDSFTEVGPATPLTYNTIKDDALTILLGSRFDSNLTPVFNLHGSLGIEHDIYHTIDKLEPTGMSGLPTVNLDSNLKKTRPVVSLGFDYDLSSNKRFSGVIQYQELAFESMTQTNAYFYYSMAF